ncbi:Uncharacterized protein APZ42_006340 [Daphnia magna]|uniref:Uncharacterized protein n=1 Tax=Daphnia magna TaxID=35525 RepID=A0A164FYI8_9CRUS|nr:Uncharacterized protein APZ42_006340 [Daphnia magna]
MSALATTRVEKNCGKFFVSTFQKVSWKNNSFFGDKILCIISAQRAREEKYPRSEFSLGNSASDLGLSRLKNNRD